MLKFTALLEKFGKKGEKTGWTYFMIRSEQTKKINPGVKTSYRVKGKLDDYKIKGVAIIPMGDGDFIMPVNGQMRKALKKQKGSKILVQLELDKTELKLSEDFIACLNEEKDAKTFFDKLPKSHQNYFSKWIDSAKTDETKAKRIAQSINGFKMKMNYPEMIRYYKANKI